MTPKAAPQKKRQPASPDDNSGSIRKTLGPIQDLERHLPPEWWRHLFNSVYLKTDGDVVENDKNTRAEIDIIVSEAALEPNDRILDLCCGQGRHSLELARRGFRHVTGMDRSRYLIRLGRRRAKKAGLAVSLHEGDARKVRIKGKPLHAILMLGNSFGYFDQEADDEAVLRSVHRALQPGGTLVLDLTDGDWMRKHYAPRSWEWIDQMHFVCRERALSRDERRLVTREVVVQAEKGVITDQFYAERLYSKEQILELLGRREFEVVRELGPFTADSDRNQDLGMMAHRMLLIARTPRKAPAVTRPGIPYPRVTVIMGDPHLPDPVKLGGKFNPQDLETVRKLKEALSEIEGYEFRYLDNHHTLVSALRSEPVEFVLNLCDEGFRNDPVKELHVPSLLELHEVPYTGAGPACLGLCYDKGLVRAVAQSLDLPVPLETYHSADDSAASLPSTFPAIIKPNLGDNSVGITQHAVVNTTSELVEYVNWLRKTMGHVAFLVQEFLTGPEYSVGVVGNPGLDILTLPILEVDYTQLPEHLPRILSYESKWQPDSPYWSDIEFHEAHLDDDTQRKLMDYSNALFERLGCRDYARFDFRADTEGTIKLLEVNPNPGWCWDGKLNKMAACAGMRYCDLLRLILEAAQERITIGREMARPKPARGSVPAPPVEVGAR